MSARPASLGFGDGHHLAHVLYRLGAAFDHGRGDDGLDLGGRQRLRHVVAESTLARTVRRRRDPGDWPSGYCSIESLRCLSILSITATTAVSSSSMRSSTSLRLIAASSRRIAPSRAVSRARMAVFMSSVMRS